MLRELKGILHHSGYHHLILVICGDNQNVAASNWKAWITCVRVQEQARVRAHVRERVYSALHAHVCARARGVHVQRTASNCDMSIHMPGELYVGLASTATRVGAGYFARLQTSVGLDDRFGPYYFWANLPGAHAHGEWAAGAR